MGLRSIVVKADWDGEAKVWVASSEDIPGLVTEAKDLDRLREKLLVMIPELVELNGIEMDVAEIPLHILTHQVELIPCIPSDGVTA